MPRGLNTEFAIGKVDHQINSANRLSVRYMFFDNFITANVAGATANIPNSVQQANDFADRQHSTGAQLVSTIGANMVNELRVQYATRAQSRVPNALSGTGPAIRISGVANFGGPIAGDHGLRLRLHAERVSDQRQHDAPARQPRLQSRHRHSARVGYANICTGGALHVPERRRLSSCRQWHEPVRIHQLHAVFRPARSRIQQQPVWLLRSGRLAA